MNATAKKSIRLLGLLAVIGLCCTAIVSPVAAKYPFDKWLTSNQTVLANTSYYATVNGTSFTNQYFFGVVGNGHYNTTVLAYNWTGDSQYSDRYYMEQMGVGGAYYPASVPGGEWQWEFVNSLDMTATIYKKGLGGYVNPASGTYYAWYGNKTAAYMTYNGHTNWLVPTYQNATYIVNLTETWA